MTRPNGDPFLVQDRSYVVGMNPIKHKGDETGFLFRGPYDSQTLNRS